MTPWIQGQGGVGWAVLLSLCVAVPGAAQIGAGFGERFGAGGGDFGAGGGGFGGSGFGGFGGFGRRVSRLVAAQEELRQREAQLEFVKQQLQTLKARHESGAAPISEVRSGELEVRQAESAVVAARADLVREKRLHDLNRSIDVDLQGATVRQAAQALSKASGMALEVDAAVPHDARITVRGRGVPMSVLLDRVAGRADLMIAPANDTGLALKNWPALEIDGERKVYKGPLAPWSTDWGVVPITNAYYSQPAAGSTVGPPPAGALGASPQGGTASGASGTGGGGKTRTARAAGGASMTGGGGTGLPGMGMSTGMGMAPGLMPGGSGASVAVGNGTVVVAEPGVKDGQSGLWLTVYKISGTSLLKIGTGFHRSNAAGGAAPARKPGGGASGLPGMGGFSGAEGEAGGFPGLPGGAIGGGGEGGFGGAIGGGGFGEGGFSATGIGGFSSTTAGPGAAPGHPGLVPGAPAAPGGFPGAPRPVTGRGAGVGLPAKPAPGPAVKARPKPAPGRPAAPAEKPTSKP